MNRQASEALSLYQQIQALPAERQVVHRTAAGSTWAIAVIGAAVAALLISGVR